MAFDISAIGSAAAASSTAQVRRESSETQSFQSALEKAAQNKDDAELKSACQDMETYFIQMMYKEMRKTVQRDNSFIPKSFTEEIFQEMLDGENAKEMTKAGGIGLADMLYRQLSKNQ